ncbi:MAG: hypothetical protein JWP91_3922 [Fibrobacteres bacterium]|nr:hypothetical protein [Fibrobacterota bacterium]
MSRILPNPKTVIAGLALWLGSACLAPVLASSCLDNRDFDQSLPTVIGKEDQVGKFPFALNCDTVFVRKGVTTTVHPGTMLYFSRPSLNSVIKVEGTLIIKGTKNSYVSLSGSLDTTRNGIETGNRPWGGIEVAEGGKLVMEYAGVMRAPTPITAFSFQVKILNSWFKGSSGMILPDGTLFAMESKWQAVNSMDLTKGNTDQRANESERPKDAISQKEKNELLAKDSGFWTWKKAAMGAGALAVVGVGFAVLLAPDEDGTPGPAVKTAKSNIDEFNAGYPE